MKSQFVIEEAASFLKNNLLIHKGYPVRNFYEFEQIIFNSEMIVSVELKDLSEFSCDEVYSLLELALPHVRFFP